MSSMLSMLLVFFLSGATALVYEVLWTRQLSLIFGITTYAVAAVLATYMGGLALGSFIVGRFVDRVRSPIMLYAGLEAAIGLYAMLVPYLLDGLRPLYVAIAQWGLPYPVFSAIRVFLAAALLMVPTTMMGATYPALIRHWVRQQHEVGRGAGILYFVNTAGAIAGCSLAGFLLIENLGLTGTNRLAAITNLVLATAAAVIARSVAASPGATAEREESEPVGERLPDATANLILFCIGLSGFVSLCAQVLWSRALLRYLYNSTYAFTAMLAMFLLGITVGSMLFTFLLARMRRPLFAFGLVQIGAGFGLVVSLLVYPNLLDFPAMIFGTAVIDSFQRSLFTMLLYAALVLLPFVISLGALFPLATYLYASGRADVGRATGRVYAANTLGAILGSLGCGFVLIPTIGMSGTQTLLIAACLIGGTLVAFAVGSRVAVAVSLVLALAGAAFAASAIAPDNVFRSTFLRNKKAKLVFYEEGTTDTVGVVQDGGGQRVIVYEDLRGTAATSTYGWNFFFGHLPMLIHPGTPKKVLHICFGVGNSLSAVAAHEELERVDNVELSPHILNAGPYFWSNDGVLQNPKVRTIIDDGRNFLMTTEEKYDVILLEPPETFTAGVINLYTVEFYRDARARLNPDGVIMQWVPTANGSLEEERELFRSFYDVFPHATMWWQLSGGSALLLGAQSELKIDYQRLKAHFDEPRVRQDLLVSKVRDVDHFLSFMIFDQEAFAEFVKDAEPVTDDNTVLDFSMPRYAGSGFGLGQFTDKVVASGRNPGSFVQERRKTYASMRRSPVPYLVNLGSESPEAVGARIEAAAKILAYPPPVAEADWKKMRATGEMPAPAGPRIAKE